MTPEEFAAKMRALKDSKGSYFEEYKHSEADDLPVECLNSLGYEVGCEVYESLDKWLE